MDNGPAELPGTRDEASPESDRLNDVCIVTPSGCGFTAASWLAMTVMKHKPRRLL